VIYQLEFKSSLTERYDSDLIDLVRMHVENSGVKVVGEFGGGSLLGTSEDDMFAAVNGFQIECDGEIALRLSKEIERMLTRAVYVEEVTL
jgi:hypothetical protein